VEQRHEDIVLLEAKLTEHIRRVQDEVSTALTVVRTELREASEAPKWVAWAIGVIVTLQLGTGASIAVLAERTKVLPPPAYVDLVNEKLASNNREIVQLRNEMGRQIDELKEIIRELKRAVGKL